MPQVNVTIDNINPLITYLPVGAWVEGDDLTDSLGANYSNGGTFTLCTTHGSFASITFNGSSVWIFGAKRENHGPYSVEIDGVTSGYDGQQPDPGLFQYPLFSATNLTQGTHQVVLTNLETDSVNHPYLDLDFVTWTTDIGEDTDTINSTVVQDTDSAFSYLPASSWITDTQNLPGFNGSTGHSTFDGNANVSFTFIGDAISLYGAVGPNASPYDVQVDGSSTSTFNATKQSYYAQVALYYADNLGPGQHTLTVVNKPSAFGQGLSIDYAIVSTVPSVSSSSGTSSAGGSGNANTSSKTHIPSLLSAGEIAGIVAGGIILIAALVYLFLYRRRRNRDLEAAQGISPFADKYSARPQSANVFVTPFVAQPNNEAPSALYPLQIPFHSTSTTTEDTTLRRSNTSNVPGSDSTSPNSYLLPSGDFRKLPLRVENLTPSNVSSYSRSHSSTLLPSGDFRKLGVENLTPSNVSSYSRSHSSTASSTHVHGPLISPSGELRVSRMRVEGRVQDFGPVQPVDDAENEELLPPDYTQATEPYPGPVRRREVE